MTGVSTRKGPGLSRAQRIGDLARSALHANKPDNWVLGELSGDDFGYDFQAHAFDPVGEDARCVFNIQLKGTTKKKARLADGKVLSYPFDRSTLNLWHRSGFAVLVVIVDLIDTQDQKAATVHYHLANDDLEGILPSLPLNQKTVRLHVPINQMVHKKLDVLPLVLSYLDDIADARRLTRERRRAGGAATPDRVLFGAADPNASARLSQDSGDDELERFIATSLKKSELQAALTALREGEHERVLELCPHPTEDACKVAPQDTAVAAHLRSMALEAVGDSKSANELTTLALSLLPNFDGIVGAAAQNQLNAIQFGSKGQHAREELLKSLEPYSGLCATSVKSKILALNDDFDRAREILKPFPPEKTATTATVISILERAWDRVLAEIEVARNLPSMRPKQRLWLDIFEARARFEFAFRAVPSFAKGDFIVPSTGLPQVDYNSLRLAYQTSRRAMLAAQRLNWPADITYILDVFPVSTMLLGYAAEAIPLMAALGLARATVTPIREAVAKMAVQFDQPEIALRLGELAGASPRFEHEPSLMAVAAVKAGQMDKALKFVTDDFLADPSSKDVYLTSLLMLGMAANSTLRTDLVEKIRARLDSNAEARNWGAILDSAISVQQSLLQRPEAIQKLYAFWSKNGQPTVIGYHLLTNTDPRSMDEARLFVDVASNLEVEHSLGNEQLADYGQALLTIDRVGDAVTKLRAASARFPDDPKIQSMLGVALEVDGQSPEAFKMFEQLLNEGRASDTARRYFVEIAARMGFFNRAEQQVRAAYAKATTHSRKLQLLNTLFQILIAEGKRPEQIEEVAWEYGRQANQSDEHEEGIFLQEYVLATLRDDLTIQPERSEELRRRIDTYSERFPNSKFLWRAELPTGGPPETMLAALQEAVGLTDRDIEEGNATERKMDRGALEVPFSWRPRRFLRNISDIFMLWEIRKRAPVERAALHFRSSIAGHERQVPKDIGACEAVLSLTSLLLLDELELLSLVLETFPRVVVARATLIALQEGRNMFTSVWGRERATRIMEQLQRSFFKIGHPPYVLETSQPGAPDWYHEEKRAMEQAGRVYFSDDIVETYLVCCVDEKSPPRASVSTVNFLAWADEAAGIVSPRHVADAIGHMTRLRVLAVPVEQRYFIAAIPDALSDATSQEQAEVVLRNAQTFKSILDGLWHHLKPFPALQTHFAVNMSYLLNDTEASEEVLVSLWLRWLETVRFQTEPSISPLKKMLSAFRLILEHLNSEKEVVSRLWCSFWTALHRGLAGDLGGPEDQVAIKEVARLLGWGRAIRAYEATAIALFEKARMGLEPGTEREAWFNNEYVDAMVQREHANQAER